MEYEEVKERIFARATVPDGYFGNTLRLGLAMIGNVTVEIHDHGYHRAHIGEAASEKEAYWLLEQNRRYSKLEKVAS